MQFYAALNMGTKKVIFSVTSLHHFIPTKTLPTGA